MSALPSVGYLSMALFGLAVVVVTGYLVHFTSTYKTLPSKQKGSTGFLAVVIVAMVIWIAPMIWYFNYAQSLTDTKVTLFNSGAILYCKESIGFPKLRRVSTSDGFIYDASKEAFIHKSDGLAYTLGFGGENCR
jgi:uncharacterized membrane protein YdbT with pleckstrin-like domain